MINASGTLGRQPHWLFVHKKLVLFMCAGLIVLGVVLVIIGTIVANNNATKTTAQIKDATYNLKTNVQAFGKRAAALNIKTSTDADKAIAQLDSLQKDLDNTKLPVVNAPPLANTYSPAYTQAAKDLAQAQKLLSDLKIAVADITAFAHYNHGLAQVFENPALTKTISDANSATASATAWMNAKTAAAKLTPPASAKSAHTALLGTLDPIIAYCGSLAEAYKKSDQNTLNSAATELDKRIQAVRSAAANFDTIATQLAQKFNQASANLN